MRYQLMQDGWTRFNQGLEFLEAGDYGRARDHFATSLELAPAEYRGLVHCMLAKTAILLCDWGTAFQEATAAIKLDPSSELAFGLRATAHSALGQHREAIADFTELLKLDPTDARAYLERGRVQMMLRQDLVALADFNHALRLEPKLEGLHLCRAHAYYSLGHWTAAIKAATDSIRLGDCLAAAYFVRATCRQECGEHHLAIEDLNRVIELWPLAAALETRASSYRELGDDERAVADERAAAELAYLDVGVVNLDEDAGFGTAEVGALDTVTENQASLQP